MKVEVEGDVVEVEVGGCKVWIRVRVSVSVRVTLQGARWV